MALHTGLLTGFLTQVELNIVAGYGSPKDVAVYAALGLSPSQTYIVGRAVRKLQAQCQVREGWEQNSRTKAKDHQVC